MSFFNKSKQSLKGTARENQEDHILEKEQSEKTKIESRMKLNLAKALSKSVSVKKKQYGKGN